MKYNNSEIVLITSWILKYINLKIFRFDIKGDRRRRRRGRSKMSNSHK